MTNVTFDKPVNRHAFYAGDGILRAEDSLRLPFSVEVRNLSREDLEALVSRLECELGGVFFRTRELFLEVLEDHLLAYRKPLTYHQGVFLSMVVKDDGTLRITSGHECVVGGTCYAYDQLEALLDGVARHRAAEAAQPRPRG